MRENLTLVIVFPFAKSKVVVINTVLIFITIIFGFVNGNVLTAVGFPFMCFLGMGSKNLYFINIFKLHSKIDY